MRPVVIVVVLKFAKLVVEQVDVFNLVFASLRARTNYFAPVERKGRVEVRRYLEQLCAHFAEALRDVRPIVVKVDTALYSQA